MNNDLKITISGQEGAGKSELMFNIASHLKSLGHNVTCFEGDEFPVAPFSILRGERQPRNISIATRK
jgi:nitrogenase subunit NifH